MCMIKIKKLGIFLLNLDFSLCRIKIYSHHTFLVCGLGGTNSKHFMTINVKKTQIMYPVKPLDVQIYLFIKHCLRMAK